MNTHAVYGPDGQNITYWLPESVAEVVQLVDDAQANQEIICLRGAAHSFPLINRLEMQSEQGKNYKFVMLTEMKEVKIDKEARSVIVQAGCNLGRDPYDPVQVSNIRNSLLYQLDQQGLAIPDLGGITHQTVGGFISTGSSGGSTTYSFGDGIQSIDIVQFVNGKAQLVTYNRPKDDNNLDDPFYGIGVGLGLMGVIVSVTFNCVDKFYIRGNETTSHEDDCVFSLIKKKDVQGKLSIEQFLRKTEYTRMLWWPQKNVNKVVVWQAKQATEQEAKPLKPYKEAPYILGSPLPATEGANLLFTAIGQWPSWFDGFFGQLWWAKYLKPLLKRYFYPEVLPKALSLFITDGVQKFSDIGWKGLPMDNQMNDKLFPVKFTELWIPIERAQEVLSTLKDFYVKGGPKATRAFTTEIYAAKQSKFWISPSYGYDVIRIDVFWFGTDHAVIGDYYEQFWSLLAQFDFRPHWGKYLPPPDGAQGITYIKSKYPKWKKWEDLRASVDPEGVFLNDYWKLQLGLKPID